MSAPCTWTRSGPCNRATADPHWCAQNRPPCRLAARRTAERTEKRYQYRGTRPNAVAMAALATRQHDRLSTLRALGPVALARLAAQGGRVTLSVVALAIQLVALAVIVVCGIQASRNMREAEAAWREYGDALRQANRETMARWFPDARPDERQEGASHALARP